LHGPHADQLDGFGAAGDQGEQCGQQLVALYRQIGREQLP
jgi:hypothetical protein